jgi:hypothetical protein
MRDSIGTTSATVHTSTTPGCQSRATTLTSTPPADGRPAFSSRHTAGSSSLQRAAHHLSPARTIRPTIGRPSTIIVASDSLHAPADRRSPCNRMWCSTFWRSGPEATRLPAKRSMSTPTQTPSGAS